MKKRVFAIFQGGGARGISHVGAISILEDTNIEIVGVGGTSAGAIVAALKAVGFNADEIFDIQTHKSILALIDINDGKAGVVQKQASGPKDLFGRGGWLAVMAAKWAYENRDTVPLAWGIGFISLIGYVHVHIGFLYAWIAYSIVSLGCLFWVLKGLASLDGFVTGLDQILRTKVRVQDGALVTFGDLRDAGCLPLRIVATNASDSCERVFSAERSETVSVAEAVAASACLPFIFRARSIEDKFYFDGGLVSNLPAWVFDEERALDLHAATVAIEIRDETNGFQQTEGKLSLVKRAFVTALSGVSLLEKRAVSKLSTIELAPQLGLLDFDMSLQKAAVEIQNAQNEAKLGLISKVVTVPNQMDGFCERIAFEALQILNSWRSRSGKSDLIELPRVAFLLPPTGSNNSLQIKYSYGFEGFSDQNIVLPIDNSFVGTAWRNKASIYTDKGQDDWDSTLDRPSDQGLRNRIKQSLHWIVAIPHNYLEFQGNSCVLALDGQEPLCLEESEYRGMLAELTFKFRDRIDESVPVEVFQDGY